MMSTYKYDASLRVRHPKLEANEICEKIGLSAAIIWNVGDQRMTPKGKNLDGVYRETYCSFHLPHESDQYLPELLAETNKQLKNTSSFLNKIISSGGNVEYFIGWYFNKNTGEIFDSELLQELSELGISLSFDFYP